jgi:hypothetical protein
MMNFISTQVLINSLDFSLNSRLAISAGMSFALKEGIGQIGTIIFTGMYGNLFEKNVRQWRMVGTLLFNTAFILECVSMGFPARFLVIASFASLCKGYVYFS